MQGSHNGHTGVRRGGQQRHDGVRGGGVEVRCRLVQQQHGRLGRECPGQHRAPGLPAGYLVHTPVRQMRHAALLQCRIDRRRVAMRNAPQCRDLPDRQAPGGAGTLFHIRHPPRIGDTAGQHAGHVAQ